MSGNDLSTGCAFSYSCSTPWSQSSRQSIVTQPRQFVNAYPSHVNEHLYTCHNISLHQQQSSSETQAHQHPLNRRTLQPGPGNVVPQQSSYSSLRCNPGWESSHTQDQKNSISWNIPMGVYSLPPKSANAAAQFSSFPSSTSFEGNGVPLHPSPSLTEDFGPSPEPQSPISPLPGGAFSFPHAAYHRLQEPAVTNPYSHLPVKPAVNEPMWQPSGYSEWSMPCNTGGVGEFKGYMHHTPSFNSTGDPCYSHLPLTTTSGIIGGTNHPFPASAVLPYGQHYPTPVTSFHGATGPEYGLLADPLQMAPASFSLAEQEHLSMPREAPAFGSSHLPGAPYRPTDRNDEMLVSLKETGCSYRQIKKLLGLDVAESTLRGRYRTLTKAKEQRVRRPEWFEVDLNLLEQAVDIMRDGQDYSKVSWKNVSEHIANNGGTYKFGASTCKKKWHEITQEEEAEEEGK